MNQRIEAKLVGSEQAKVRRAKLVADLTNAFADGGSQAATDIISLRMDNLVDACDTQLQYLKKQL